MFVVVCCSLLLFVGDVVCDCVLLCVVGCSWLLLVVVSCCWFLVVVGCWLFLLVAGFWLLLLLCEPSLNRTPSPTPSSFGVASSASDGEPHYCNSQSNLFWGGGTTTTCVCYSGDV